MRRTSLFSVRVGSRLQVNSTVELIVGPSSSGAADTFTPNLSSILVEMDGSPLRLSHSWLIDALSENLFCRKRCERESPAESRREPGKCEPTEKTCPLR